MYTAFARVYDRLMRTVDYEGWAGHYRALLAACQVPPDGRAVECACGTGNLTIPLRRGGLKLTAWIYRRKCWPRPWKRPGRRG